MTYTDEQIEAMANGQDIMGVATPVEEAPADEGAEDDTAPADETEQVDEESTEEDQPAIDEDTQPKQRRKPSDRIREVVAQKNELKALADAKDRELMAMQIKYEQQQAATQKLIDAMNGKREAEPEEVLDEVLDRKVSSEIEAIRGELAASQLQQRLAQEQQVASQSFPDFQDADAFLIAATANKILTRAEMVGRPLSNEDAIGLAQRALTDEFATIAKHNKSVGAIAKYVYSSAEQYGYKPKASAKAKPSVDMKAVQRARDEAGAPAIRKENVASGGANWSTEIGQWGKTDGLSEAQIKSLIGQ